MATTGDPTALQQVRNRQYLSQKELADILGVTPKTVQRWESGKSKPGLYAQRKLYEHFGVTPEALGFITSSSNGEISQLLDTINDMTAGEEDDRTIERVESEPTQKPAQTLLRVLLLNQFLLSVFLASGTVLVFLAGIRWPRRS